MPDIERLIILASFQIIGKLLIGKTALIEQSIEVIPLVTVSRIKYELMDFFYSTAEKVACNFTEEFSHPSAVLFRNTVKGFHILRAVEIYKLVPLRRTGPALPYLNLLFANQYEV